MNQWIFAQWKNASPDYIYWPEINWLPDISPAKMGLFKINRELHFRVCNHGEPRASPFMAREGEHFYREEKEVGRYSKKKKKKESWLSISWVLARKEEESFFFLLGSAVIIWHESSHFPDSWLSLIEVAAAAADDDFFTFPPFDWELSLIASLIKSQVFWFQRLFLPWCQGRTFPGCSVSCWRESKQIRNLLRWYSSNEEG